MRTTMALLAVLAIAGAAQAGIQWTWVNAGTGTEQGIFVTDGELVGGLAPAGTYTLVDFSVTASAYDLVLGTFADGDYVCSQPDFGFDWDGAGCTCFWRASGFYTNGFGYHVPDPQPGAPDCVGFNVDYFLIDFDEDVTFLQEFQTPVITPESTVTGECAGTLGGVKRLYR